jgi:hypothetical protein
MHAGLKPRDVALSKSLNEDKFSQLFVKVDETTLDQRLVAPHTHPDLPEDARSLLVLKRGTGTETSEGQNLGALLPCLALPCLAFPCLAHDTVHPAARIMHGFQIYRCMCGCTRQSLALV